MTSLTPLPAWQRNRIGDWTAELEHRGLHVHLDVMAAEPGWCPCQPGDCEHPGAPSVVVYATSSAPMTTPAAGARCDLTTVEQGIHVAGDAGHIPSATVNTVALLLVTAAADTGLAALAELAAHAAAADEAPDVHTFFGLSYANYLVVPRTLLQSMPDQWQQRFTGILSEMQEAFGHVPQADAYKVTAAEVREPGELSPGQLTAAGTGKDEQPCEDDHEHDPGGCLPAVTYTDLGTGRELHPGETVLLAVPDPVPAYNRGRTRLEPRAREGSDR